MLTVYDGLEERGDVGELWLCDTDVKEADAFDAAFTEIAQLAIDTTNFVDMGCLPSSDGSIEPTGLRFACNKEVCAWRPFDEVLFACSKRRVMDQARRMRTLGKVLCFLLEAMMPF